MGRIVLCAESESLQHPELLGLEEGVLNNKDWLVSVCDAQEARKLIRSAQDVEQAWIVASDQIDGVNLAAAICNDAPKCPVFLVSDQGNFATQLNSHFPELHILTPEQFSEAFLKKCTQPLPAKPCAPEKDKSCFVVSLFSGSGGVGKSSFAALAGCMAQKRGFRTAIIDGDVQFGDLSRLVGKTKHIAIDELLDEPGQLADHAFSPKEKSPTVIISPNRLEASEEVVGKLDKVVSLACKQFDVLFVDTSTCWGDDQIWLLENSDVCLFFLDQRASSIHSVKHAIDLCMRMGIATGSFLYLLNRCSKNAIFSGLDISNVVQGAQVAELRDGQSEVEEYLGGGLARELSGIKNEFALSINELLDDLLPAEETLFSTSPTWELPEEKETSSEKAVISVFRRRAKGRKVKEV